LNVMGPGVPWFMNGYSQTLRVPWLSAKRSPPAPQTRGQQYSYSKACNASASLLKAALLQFNLWGLILAKIKSELEAQTLNERS